MPLINEKHWRDRFGEIDPCWSGEKWLDWQHATVVRRALKRAWPGVVSQVVDAGCGDGKWTKWMHYNFNNDLTVGTDAIEFPHARDNGLFLQIDAEELADAWPLDRPDMVVSLNAVTCMQDWRKACEQMRKLSTRYVLVFDNFQTPTPPWAKGLPHRRPIELPELVRDFRLGGYTVAKVVTGDVWHRRLFLKTPKWMHPAVAVVSAGLDLAAAYTISPRKARHQAVLFERKSA